MQHVLMKIKLKPGTFQKFMKYVEEFSNRREECNDSLKGEGCNIESFFIVGEEVYVYKRVKNLAVSREYQKTSDNPIYQVVENMKKECIESVEDSFSVLAFEVSGRLKKSKG